MLNIRKQSNETLANMYNPKYMSENLIKVHKHIDQLVDKCYSKKRVPLRLCLIGLPITGLDTIFRICFLT